MTMLQVDAQCETGRANQMHDNSVFFQSHSGATAIRPLSTKHCFLITIKARKKTRKKNGHSSSIETAEKAKLRRGRGGRSKTRYNCLDSGGILACPAKKSTEEGLKGAKERLLHGTGYESLRNDGL